MSKALPFDLQLKGLRIPYVAVWDQEVPTITVDPLVKCPAVFTGTVDHREAAHGGRLGKVLLGQMAPQRQRYCMAKGVCQICGGILGLGRVLLGHAEHHGPDKLLALDEPPCCPGCALTAIAMCPYVERQWARAGAILVREYDLHIQLCQILPEDSRHRFNRSGPPLARHTFRRWMKKPLAVHMRMVPTVAATISGGKGLELLTALAAKEAEASE